MKLLLVLTLLLAFALVECVAESQFTQLCQRENYFKRQYDEMPLDDTEREFTFKEFMDWREKRVEYEQKHNLTGCYEVANIKVSTDEQVLHQLCLDKKLIELEMIKSNDESVNRELARLQQETRNKLALVKGECPVISRAELEGVESLSTQLKRLHLENCKDEIYYRYLEAKVIQIRRKFRTNLHLSSLEMSASKLGHKATRARHRFCQGNDSIASCCGEKLIEDTRITASSFAARHLLAISGSLYSAKNSTFTGERNKNNWNEKFDKLCLLEHKTGAGRKYYKARLSTLKRLNKQIHKDRVALGEALMDKRSCHEASFKSLKPTNPDANKPELEVDKRCAQEVKPSLMCRAFQEEKAKPGVLPVEFYNLYTDWCRKSDEIEWNRTSVTATLKPAKCSDEMRAVIAEDAEVDAALSIELSRLTATAKRAVELKDDLIRAIREAYELICAIEKLYKEDFNNQKDPARKEQCRLDYELIKKRRKELELIDGIKFNPFKSFAW